MDGTAEEFLKQDDANAVFAIILHNVRTYRSGGVVAVVQGRRNADSSLKDFQSSQSPSDYHAGWRYFSEKSDLPAGSDPAEATHRRQADLERREIKESQDTTQQRWNFPK